MGDLNVGYHVASVQMPLLAKYTNDWQVLTGRLLEGWNALRPSVLSVCAAKEISEVEKSGDENTTLLNSYYTALAQRKSTPYGEMGVRLSQASTL